MDKLNETKKVDHEDDDETVTDESEKQPHNEFKNNSYNYVRRTTQKKTSKKKLKSNIDQEKMTNINSLDVDSNEYNDSIINELPLPLFYGILPPLNTGQCAECLDTRQFNVEQDQLTSISSTIKPTNSQTISTLNYANVGGTSSANKNTFHNNSTKKQLNKQNQVKKNNESKITNKRNSNKNHNKTNDNDCNYLKNDINIQNNELNISPILLCDGSHCSREYHISCLNPPLTSAQIPTGDWYCSDCDPLGTSRHLIQYFEKCSETRESFSCSRDYVEALLQDAEVIADKGVLIDLNVMVEDLAGKNIRSDTIKSKAKTKIKKETTPTKHSNNNKQNNQSPSSTMKQPKSFIVGSTHEELSCHSSSTMTTSKKCKHGGVGTSSNVTPRKKSSSLSPTKLSSSSTKFKKPKLENTKNDHTLTQKKSKHLKINCNQNLNQGKQTSTTNKSNHLPSKTTTNDYDMKLYKSFPKSELWKIAKFHTLALQASSSTSTNTTKMSSSPKHGNRKPNIVKTIMGMETVEQCKKKYCSHPSFLVGKHIRLYCPVDNCYHIGRILNWRKADIPLSFDSYHNNKNHNGRKKKRKKEDLHAQRQQEHDNYENYHLTNIQNTGELFHGKGDIAASEFLVCFPEGMNGRKKRILQWIILEEHSLAVSISIIWGQLNKTRGLNGWKPAQTLLRTSLELVPVRDTLVDDDDDDDEDYEDDKQDYDKHESKIDNCNIKIQDIEIKNEGLKEERKLRNCSINNTNASPTSKISKKKSKYSKLEGLVLFFGEDTFATLRLHDEAVDFFSPAFQQIRFSHYQSGCNPNYTPSPFTYPSNDNNATASSNFSKHNSHLALAVSLATMENEEQQRLKHWQRLPLQSYKQFHALTLSDEATIPSVVLDDEKKEDNPIFKQIHCTRKQMLGTLRSTNIILPKLCPSMEQGIDRLWLADLIGTANMEKSLDTMASFSVQSVDCVPSAMAQYRSSIESSMNDVIS